MATSSSINLTATAADIVKEALELVGGLDQNGTPTSDQYASTLRSLNYMVKALQADGQTNLFAIQQVTVFLETAKNSYTLDSSTSDHYTASYTKTYLSTAGEASDGTIEVDSISGISASDNIGIELDDGTMQWTTVNGAPSGTTVTLTAALTGAAAVDNVVYVYTTKANRPMKVLRAVRSTKDTDETDTEIELVTRDEYIDIAQKTTDGTVVKAWFNPTRNSATINVWPETDDASQRLTLWVQRTLEDLDNASGTDEVDYPQEWFEALAWSLASRIAWKYGLPPTEIAGMKAVADEFREVAEGFDREDSTMMLPDDDYME